MSTETDNDIRTAILSLVRTHDRLKTEYMSLRKTFDAAVEKEPRLGLLWRDVANIELRESQIAEQESAEIRSALISNQQFADLLLDYADAAGANEADRVPLQ